MQKFGGKVTKKITTWKDREENGKIPRKNDVREMCCEADIWAELAQGYVQL
jgi:hypothetical protein